MDDIRGFFTAPSAVHLWFYLLLPVLSLYALNTALATWQNVTRRWRNGARAPQFYGAAVIHVAFLTGLLAHLIGGLGGADVDSHSDGTTKQVRARVEVRTSEGAVSRTVVRYNGPISRALGSDLLLLRRPESVPAARLARGPERCDVAVEGSCDLGGVRAELLYLHPPPRPDQGPFARVRVQVVGGGTAEVFWLMPGQSKQLADGSHLVCRGIEVLPAIRLQHRHAPGNPWALLAGVLLVLGVAMMWRRFLPAAAQAPTQG
jgi:hypothetical protein